MAVRIVTDSTADLPPELVEKWGITVVPLYVNFHGRNASVALESLRDGPDIGADAFYQRLAASSTLPTTSQPTVNDFLQQYRALCQDDDRVISVHISSKLSGTVSSALQARGQMEDPKKVEVVDSGLASMALGLAVLAGARAAAAGLDSEDVVQAVREACTQTQVFFMVDTLEYLQKGGRIGKAQALLGSLLSIRPILTVRDGEVHPLERVRTRAKALQRLASLVEERSPVSELCLMHGTTPEDITRLTERLAGVVPAEDLIVSRIGPVIGAHCGPGLLGVAVRHSA